MKIQERMPKLVIKPDEIDGPDAFGLNLNDNTVTCLDCGSHLFYIKEDLGVVAEESDYGIWGNRPNKNNRTYRVREVGLSIFCAECGAFNEIYHSFCYDKDTIVCSWDELGGAEKVEVEYCLHQWDQKGDFTPQWKSTETNVLKEKLIEYEQKHPIKLEKKKVKKKKVKGGKK